MLFRHTLANDSLLSHKEFCYFVGIFYAFMLIFLRKKK